MTYAFERMQALKDSGVIAILRGLTTSEVNDAVDRLLHHGINAIEITLDSPGALHSIDVLANRPDQVVRLGAGTVLDAESARLAIAAGAEYLISPVVKTDVIATGRRYGCPVFPGVMTPTEALTAMELGADAVKIFPAEPLGLAFIRAIRAPLPQVPLIPTGGIDARNAGEFLRAGALALGIGSSLASVSIVRSGDWGELEGRAMALRRAVDEARNAG